MAEILKMPVKDHAGDLLLEIDEMVAKLGRIPFTELLKMQLRSNAMERDISPCEAIILAATNLANISKALFQYQIDLAGEV